MGRVAAPYAIQGWVRVQPYTETLDSLLDYPVWWLGGAKGWRSYRLAEGKVHGQSLLARLQGVDDRTVAEGLTGLDVAVERDEFPAADADEFYWDDLIGLAVENAEGVTLGKVAELLATGANDVLRVVDERSGRPVERLIPFVEAYIRDVDLAAGLIRVDWGQDWGQEA